MTVLLWVVSLVRTSVSAVSYVSVDSCELVKEAERNLRFGMPSLLLWQQIGKHPNVNTTPVWVIPREQCKALHLPSSCSYSLHGALLVLPAWELAPERIIKLWTSTQQHAGLLAARPAAWGVGSAFLLLQLLLRPCAVTPNLLASRLASRLPWGSGASPIPSPG